MKNLKYTLSILCILFLASGCADGNTNLNNLGSNDDFSTNPINDDFEAPEDEVVKNTCSGFVNTQSGRLNVRTEPKITSNNICARLPSRSNITIAQDGHRDGFIRIQTSSCEQDWVYVSEKFVGLGSDCTFKIDQEVDKKEPPKEKEEDQEKEEEKERTPDSLTNTFFLENRDFNLARGPAKRWDGCKSGYKSRGGFNSDSRCGRGFFHPKFSDGLNQNFFKCVFTSAETAGYPRPQQVFINHLGTFNDRNARNSSSLSNHAFARAIDIKNFILIDRNNQTHKVSTLLRDYRGRQAVFYDNFRQCWKESLSRNCRPGQREYKGSIGHRSSKLGGNTLHNDHIHLSFPTCAG